MKFINFLFSPSNLRGFTLKEFFNNDLTGDYLATPKGKLLNCNKAFALKLGYDNPKELIGRNITEFHQNINEREDFLTKLNHQKILEGYLSNLKRKDGKNIICRENIVGKFDYKGNLKYYFGYLYDVTEQLNAKKEILKKNQILSSIIETQEELIVRYYPDTTIIFANKPYCNFFGKSEEELIGTKFLQFVPETEWSLELSKLSKLNRQNPKLVSESQAIAADGTIKTLRWTDTAIFNKMGFISEIQGTGIDLTELYLARDETLFLSRLNELLRKIALDYLSLPISEVNAFITKSLGEIGKFIKADRVYIFDYNWQLHTCSNTYEWCEDEIEPQIEYLQEVSLNDIPHWWNLHKKGLPLIIEEVFALDESDVVRHILEPQGVKSLITIPIMDNGNCLGFVGLDYVQNYYKPSKRERDVLFVFADVLVNIRKRTENEVELLIAKEKAEQSDKLKTAFINNISHEIRTPLNGILGFGQIMAESELSKEERRRYFEYLEKSSSRLMNTVTDYMDMAMLVSNTMKVNKKEFALDSIFVPLAEKMRKLCSDKGLEFKFETPNRVRNNTIFSDPELLQKIINKLADNAIKFTNEGSITIGYYENLNHFEIFVKDTGIGIEDEKLDLIFEMFKQADVTMTRGHEGSGLGLTIARGMASLLGGTLNVTSQKVAGSTFNLFLPIGVGKKVGFEDIFLTKSPKPKKEPIILIAEDDDLNFQYLAVLLNEIGNKYIHARNGNEAVDFCRQNTDISIVLMDIKMPLMTGDEATRQIRAFRPELPIIATTSYAQTGDEDRFLEAGFNGYIPKPISNEILAAIIRQYIG